MSFANKLTASRSEYIHKFTYKDSEGNLTFCYFMVKKEKQTELKQMLSKKQNINLEKYGEILGQCDGEKPTEELIEEMIDLYGFKREQLHAE